MHSEVLGELAKDMLFAFFDQEAAQEGFALAGGTGLALGYLGHRESEDLDLFTHDGESFRGGPGAVETAARACGGTGIPRRKAPQYVEYRVVRGPEKLKVDLVWDPTPPLMPREQFGDVRIESLLDLAVNKVCAVYSRGGRGGEPKDYADLHCILQMTDLSIDDLLVQVDHKMVDFNPMYFAALLSGASELDYTRWRWKKRVRGTDIGRRLEEEADRLFARYRPPDT